MGTKGAIEGVHINSLSVLSRLNLERAFFPQGQSKLFLIMAFQTRRASVNKQGFDCNDKLVCSENT